ncbi:MAG: transferase [Pseudoxanthomonas sp.]
MSKDSGWRGGRPWVRRDWRHTSLQFKGSVTQSRMSNLFPHLLDVGYTRTMLAALLLNPKPRSIGVVGLGGGSQAKFCHRHLPEARIEAIEVSADVLALRDAFRIPPDGERFVATLGDAARVLRQRRGAYDLLLIDAYDPYGLPDALSTRDFYADCRASLCDGGALASNLYDTDLRRHRANLCHAFDDKAVFLDEPKMSNKVAFAWVGDIGGLDAANAVAGMPWLARRQLLPGLKRLQMALSG